MFTIICCSVHPELADNLKKNIAETIGDVPYEILITDNRGKSDGICKVYNDNAQMARYDNLCFVHEDVKFLTPNWGKTIAEKLQEEDCGVIGFAGSTIRTNVPCGWRQGTRSMVAHYIQGRNGRTHKARTKNTINQQFTQVVTLDGMCMMVRRDVWATHQFDTILLTGFHGYDIDFTMSVAVDYKNWVCNVVDIEHFSVGNYSPDWVETMQALNDKWQSYLPMTAQPMSPREMDSYQQESEQYHIRFMWQKGFFDIVPFMDGVKHILQYPLKPLSWKLLVKYPVYRIRAIRKKR